MDNAFKSIMRWGLGLACLLFIVWPLLALPAKDFSKGYFTFWCETAATDYSHSAAAKDPSMWNCHRSHLQRIVAATALTAAKCAEFAMLERIPF